MISKKGVSELAGCLATRFGHRPVALLLRDLMRTDMYKRNVSFQKTISALVIENVMQAKQANMGGTVDPEATMMEVSGPPVLEIVIRDDGKTVWVNDETRCRLRACDIERLVLRDQRKDQSRTLSKAMARELLRVRRIEKAEEEKGLPGV